MTRPKMIDAQVLKWSSNGFRPYPVRAYAIRGPFPFIRVLAHHSIGSSRNWYLTDAKSGCSLVWGGAESVAALLTELAHKISVRGISQQKAAAMRATAMRESHSRPLNTTIPDSAYQPWPGVNA